jgi:hypothetical protein
MSLFRLDASIRVGVWQHFKTWVDMVITDPRMAAGTQPILAGKPAVPAQRGLLPRHTRPAEAQTTRTAQTSRPPQRTPVLAEPRRAMGS